MNRQEAIRILKKELEITKDIDKRFGDFPEHREALEIAISSLETDEAYQLEYERTTKNDLGVDTVSRQAVLDLMIQKWGDNFSGDDAMQESIDAIRVLPSVTPQEPQTFKWCTDCKEYDQEKHCCHRWSKVIRNAVDELKQEPKTGHWIPTYGNVKCSVCGSVKDSRDVGKATHYCDFCGAKMVEEQQGENT